MRFVDLALAQRIERVSMAIESSYAKTFATLEPDRDIEVAEIGGGIAVFAGDGSPMSQATGFGLDGEVAERDVAALASFYARRQSQARVVVCPMADPSLLKLLGEHGFWLSDFEQVMIRDLSASEFSEQTTGVRVRIASPEDKETYINAVGPNFTETGVMTPDMIAMMGTLFAMDDAPVFLGEIEGRAVGGGSLLIRDGVAMLAGAATLPEFRNRGVHSALFSARLDHAKALGCEFAVMGAAPGSVSQKNAERKAFRLAYTKVNLVKT